MAAAGGTSAKREKVGAEAPRARKGESYNKSYEKINL